MTKTDAIGQVDMHVSHKECFITFHSNSKGWKPIDGTGCAHYVAHVLGIRKGVAGSNACMEGFAIRVPQLTSDLSTVLSTDVRVNDIWANAGLTHCGIVTKVTPKTDKQPLIIEITHCSSSQHGVVTNQWHTHFGSGGNFYRSGSQAASLLGPRRVSYQTVIEALG